MVSLMIVLTVYYFVTDKDHFAFSFVPENEYADVEDMEEEIDIEETELTYENEFFTTTRIELEDQRSVQKERLEEVIKASHVSAEEVNEALDEIEHLEMLAMQESVSEQTILSLSDDYEDVLVRAEDDKVNVHLLTEQLEREEAAHIMQVVRDETGISEVEINYQSLNEK